MFGITETTVHVTYRRILRADVEAGAGSVIGVPIADLDVYVLDPRQQLVPVGVTGEIYVGGAGVARGYLDRADLTRTRFLVDPVGGTAVRLYRSGDLGRWLPSGELEYRGRIDDQVKIRGFRIELGEIEAVVRQCPGVRNATVIAWGESGSEPRLATYVVLESGVSVETLRRFVQGTLPEYMVPAAFVPLPVLPLTSNGKIDRRALPAPSAPVRTGRYVAPRNETERLLADVWAAVLRCDAVGIDDNFFELGGDSILSIQVIARCRQAGLHVTTRDLFRLPTVARLASAARVSPAPVSVKGRGQGNVPLTPIAHWFFEQPLANRAHWNQAFLFQVPADLDLTALDAALAAVAVHHDAFGVRFREEEAGWRARHATSNPGNPSAAVQRVNLQDGPAETLSGAIESAAASAQASLDIADGPLLRVLHFACPEGTPGRLLIIVHHLAIDAVSWRVLLEDLESAYVAVCAGREPALPHTTSFQTWAERLSEYADKGAREGLAGWTAKIDPQAAALPCDRRADPSANTEASAATITVELTAADTDSLLHRSGAAHGTRINDILLSALAGVVASWTGRDDVLVDVEGHGREEVVADADLSRTIGWFTTMFPVHLHAGDRAPGTLVRRTKEALRRLHQHGLSCGVLRYLSSDAGVRAAVRDAPRPQLLFNYLGQLDAMVSGSAIFTLSAESAGRWRAGENRRSHLIDVLAFVSAGRLTMQWNYSQSFHDATTIRAVARRYAEGLRDIVAYCAAEPASRHTPSDFPLAELGQPALDDLTNRFPAMADVYPLTPMQRLFFSMDAGRTSPGFEQWEFLIEGPLDCDRLRQAWQQVAARHSILRTAFVQAGSSRPHQVVLDRVEIPWLVKDWRTHPPEHQEELRRDFLAIDQRLPFDLAAPPLMRVALLRTGDTAHHLIWSTHHLVVDGWSWPRIFSEVSALYESGAATELGPGLPYREYVAWLLARNTASDDAFWRDLLHDVVNPTPLPLSSSAGGRRRESDGVVVRSLGAPATSAIGALARRHQVTHSAIIGAAWSVVLAHHSGRSDVVFGASFSGRPDGLPGVETLVGPCVNNLPVRVRVESGVRVGEWLRQLHELMGELSEHQTTPLTSIHMCSGVPAWSRLFDSLLVVQNYSIDAKARTLGPLTVCPLQWPESTNYPATVVVRPGDSHEVRVLGLGGRFGELSAAVAADDLVAVMGALAERGDGTVGELLACLSSETRAAAGGAVAAHGRRGGSRLAPRTDMERALMSIWGQLFDGEIGTDENYFELGVHSLMLLHAHERITSAIRPDLPVVALFQYPTVRDLAAHLTASAGPSRHDADIRARAQMQRLAAEQRQTEAKVRRRMSTAAARTALHDKI